ncbi:MAG: methyltransferase domain-containing protein [Desulfobacteraceae bacterium]|nr:methyltransferase domain-containing protein [Desulfobacteraceae bacterium]MBC2755692.1 methyltransferase domain-containing protein [Desulfobacteraceae bacterium]
MEIEKFLKWERLELRNKAVYIDPEAPNWVVPNQIGDKLLKQIRQSRSVEKATNAYLFSFNGNKNMGLIRAEQFISLFPDSKEDSYPGRGRLLKLNQLKECWLHITDRCNLSCRHCLFSCSGKTLTTLSIDTIRRCVDEAYRLGTRLFYLTGGEPFTHPQIDEICRLILTGYDDTDLVILTNGLLLSRHVEKLKQLPLGRLHLQISIDGTRESHDQYRGNGTYDKLTENIASISALNIHKTLAMAVHSENVMQMSNIVDIAAGYNISEVHYLWLFVFGNATSKMFVPPDQLYHHLVETKKKAAQKGIVIDNIRNMESQIYSSSGTKYDLGNAGWESLAIGPDGSIYPTPALIGNKKALSGHIDESIETVWRHSPALSQLRSISIIDDDAYMKNPLRYLVGGGDIDHSFYAGNTFTGHDPYIDLYNKMALWLITHAALDKNKTGFPKILMKMGDRLLQCDHNSTGVALTHSNCVLNVSSTRQVVGDFYSEAAIDPNTDIANPVCYPKSEISHIPQSARIRSYGCGSPVLDADLQKNEVVVDLGSGAGMECFIAARQVGKNGHVYGIDMLDHMLIRANQSLESVAEKIGYKNIEFRKGFLESIPVDDNTADVVISNCVINLSEDKRKTFSEILRILKPGGRLVISDVVTDSPPPPEISNDEQLRGECISGAMLQPYLTSMLENCGFNNIQFLKRFFYREVKNHPFFSLTYTACKPKNDIEVPIIYPGPFAAVITDDGKLVIRGHNTMLDQGTARQCNDQIFILDAAGNASNINAENTCACFQAPVEEVRATALLVNILDSGSIGAIHPVPDRFASGCMVCGTPLTYLENDRQKKCAFCGIVKAANAVCENNHFVCDDCHSSSATDIVRHICVNTDETDMIDLFNMIRCHPSIPLHGPEYHFIVPGVIVATYRNLGGQVSDNDIQTAIDRGKTIPGGVCAFWGGCGAALGTGAAFAVLLKGNPIKASERKMVQQITGTIINKINKLEAARCCQRETWTALKTAAELSMQYLEIPLRADGATHCTQQSKNKECMGKGCPYIK